MHFQNNTSEGLSIFYVSGCQQSAFTSKQVAVG
jgi:hypothetical protein